MQGLVKKLWAYELTESDIRLSSRYLMSPDTVTEEKVQKPPAVLRFDILGNKHGNIVKIKQQTDPANKQ
jgi:hypothetical protein